MNRFLTDLAADRGENSGDGSAAEAGPTFRVFRVAAGEGGRRHDLELSARLLDVLGAPATMAGDASRPLDDQRIRWTGDLLTRAVTDLCAAGPVVLHLDDIHWCDQPSLRLVNYLLLRSGRLPLLLVLTGRPHSSPGLDELRRHAEVGGTVLRLDGFDADELDELCDAVGAGRQPRRRLQSLVDATGGNPLWLAMLLAHQGGNAIAPATDVGAPPPPESLASLVHRRLAACPPDGRRFAAVVTVLGRACAPAQAAVIADVANPASALGDALRHGLVTTSGQPPHLRVVPPHALIRAAVYHALDLAERTAMHLAVARSSTDPATALEHRAAATLVPDGALAVELEQQAATESAAGLHIRSADHLMLAAAVSPDQARARGLRLDAAMSFLQGGEQDEAAAALGDGAGRDPERPARYRYVRAHLDLLSGDREAGERGLVGSWAEARSTGDAATAAQSAAWLAQVNIPAGHYREAQLWGRRAFAETAASSAHRALGLVFVATALTAEHGGQQPWRSSTRPAAPSPRPRTPWPRCESAAG